MACTRICSLKISSKKGLIGSKFRFPNVTVTGTANLIMAAVLAKGGSIFINISIGKNFKLF